MNYQGQNSANAHLNLSQENFAIPTQCYSNQLQPIPQNQAFTVVRQLSLTSLNRSPTETQPNPNLSSTSRSANLQDSSSASSSSQTFNRFSQRQSQSAGNPLNSSQFNYTTSMSDPLPENPSFTASQQDPHSLEQSQTATIDFVNSFFNAEIPELRQKALEYVSLPRDQREIILIVMCLKSTLMQQQNARLLRDITATLAERSFTPNKSVEAIVKDEVSRIFGDPSPNSIYEINLDEIMSVVMQNPNSNIKQSASPDMKDQLRKLITTSVSSESHEIKRKLRNHAQNKEPLAQLARALFADKYNIMKRDAMNMAALMRWFETKDDTEQYELMGYKVFENVTDNNSNLPTETAQATSSKKRRYVNIAVEEDDYSSKKAKVRKPYMERFSTFIKRNKSLKSHEEWREFVASVAQNDELLYSKNQNRVTESVLAVSARSEADPMLSSGILASFPTNVDLFS